MAALVPLFVAGAAAAALAAALISQYGFDLQPCVLCIWQRWPYLAAILLGLAAVGLRRHAAARTALTALAILAVLTSGGIGAFHVGVEQGWWEGTSGCGSISTTDDLAALRAQIMNAPIVRCDEVAFALFGISMAGWNLLFALGVALVAGRAMLRGRRALPGDRA
ncbi:MAG: disulfide bond formation protein B [Thalassobaculum sp.]|jgi:disulfide bond formation protein DsbB